MSRKGHEVKQCQQVCIRGSFPRLSLLFIPPPACLQQWATKRHEFMCEYKIYKSLSRCICGEFIPSDEHTSQPCHSWSQCLLGMLQNPKQHLVSSLRTHIHWPALPLFMLINWAGGESYQQGQWKCVWNEEGGAVKEEVNMPVNMPAERSCVGEGLKVKDQICLTNTQHAKRHTTDKHISAWLPATHTHTHTHTHAHAHAHTHTHTLECS